MPNEHVIHWGHPHKLNVLLVTASFPINTCNEMYIISYGEMSYTVCILIERCVEIELFKQPTCKRHIFNPNEMLGFLIMYDMKQKYK